MHRGDFSDQGILNTKEFKRNFSRNMFEILVKTEQTEISLFWFLRPVLSFKYFHLLQRSPVLPGIRKGGKFSDLKSVCRHFPKLCLRFPSSLTELACTFFYFGLIKRPPQSPLMPWAWTWWKIDLVTIFCSNYNPRKPWKAVHRCKSHFACNFS